MFKETDFGKPLNEKLSELLKKHTKSTDRTRVYEETGVGMDILRRVVYRDNANLTPENSVGVLELVGIALERCNEAYKDRRELKKYHKVKTA